MTTLHSEELAMTLESVWERSKVMLTGWSSPSPDKNRLTKDFYDESCF